MRLYQIHPNMIAKWKREALEGFKEMFSRGSASARRDHEEEIKRLQAKGGKLVDGAGFLPKALDR